MSALVALAGCSAPEDPVNAPTSAPISSDTPSVTASPSIPATNDSMIAMAEAKEISYSDEPGGPTTGTVTSEDVLTVPDETPLVFLVKSVSGDNVELYLPIRPNGSTGWVPASEVNVYATDLSVDVYIENHELTVSQDEVVVATYPIGTGQDELPTPGGVYFLRELLAPPDPTGPYGPYAYGLSGYSPVLDSFKGGDAVIGIHGTNDPDSIGNDVSHGCIRMNNADITQLVETWQLPLGTPVYIHA